MKKLTLLLTFIFCSLNAVAIPVYYDVPENCKEVDYVETSSMVKNTVDFDVHLKDIVSKLESLAKEKNADALFVVTVSITAVTVHDIKGSDTIVYEGGGHVLKCSKP